MHTQQPHFYPRRLAAFFCSFPLQCIPPDATATYAGLRCGRRTRSTPGGCGRCRPGSHPAQSSAGRVRPPWSVSHTVVLRPSSQRGLPVLQAPGAGTVQWLNGSRVQYTLRYLRQRPPNRYDKSGCMLCCHRRNQQHARAAEAAARRRPVNTHRRRFLAGLVVLTAPRQPALRCALTRAYDGAKADWSRKLALQDWTGERTFPDDKRIGLWW